MVQTQLLPGIAQHTITTDRLEVAYLEAGGGNIPLMLVHGNCSSSLFFQDFMQALAVTGRYKIYAPDMRGYGESETLPVDATRGVRDYSDDIDAFVRAMQLDSFHLFGWSLGGNIVMQYAIDYAGTLRSLMLQAPGSPFGFGGTKDAGGTPTWPDFAGSGGGTVNTEFLRLLAEGDRGDSQFSPRTTMVSFYFKPPFRPEAEREERYLTSLLTTKVGTGNYPGDMTPSDNWPNVAPGTQGVINALSPKYLKQGDFADISSKPPVLWVHGADDQIVSDTSLFDIGFLGQLGAVPGWPGVEIFPPQPMKTQIRFMLEHYKANGGQYQEEVIPDCGHSPHIEKQEAVLELVDAFIVQHDGH
ncbi:MAG TPA: alpha/beta hydrolase [Ktedonobacteraceae bacterium]|nr:alpha/beta hydrolase [Ktedonobacteraceae bacterium]